MALSAGVRSQPGAGCVLTPVLGATRRSLEAVSGLESNGRAFTVHAQGLLQLQVRPEGSRL